MVERAAGFPQAPATPTATPPKPVNHPKNGQQAAHDDGGGLGVAPGNWGSPPGLTEPSEFAPGPLSLKQQAANEAEVEADKAFLQFQTANAALAEIDPNDKPAISAAKSKVVQLQNLAVEKAQFNLKCQTIAGNRNVFDGAFLFNRFERVTGPYPSRVQCAEIYVERASETLIGLAYTARENVLIVGGQLAYANQWLAKDPENPAARAEVARCQKACLKATNDNLFAWERAKEQASYGRNDSDDTPQMRECKAGWADADELKNSIRNEMNGGSPAQTSSSQRVANAPENGPSEASASADEHLPKPIANSPLIVGDLIDLRARDLVHIAEATQRKVYQAGNRFVEADWALRDIKRRHNTERELAEARNEARRCAQEYLRLANESVAAWDEARLALRGKVEAGRAVSDDRTYGENEYNNAVSTPQMHRNKLRYSNEDLVH